MSMSSDKVRNVHACLVHEKPECIVDLVRNLQSLDPDSAILLYNGSTDSSLLTNIPNRLLRNVHIVPGASPKAWGWLHDFAIECMSYALEHFAFDTLTIVDSDQLAIGPGYSHYLKHVCKTPDLGMLVNAPERQGPYSEIDPVKQIAPERDLWEQYLEGLPEGKDAFVHWTFWPSTVFTRRCAEELVWLFQHDENLHALLRQTSLWASEEILFPTLTRALGFKLKQNPCSFDYVQYKQDYTRGEMDAALERRDCFFAHPVPRQIDDPLRRQIASRFGNYACMPSSVHEATQKIYTALSELPGWLSDLEIGAVLSLMEGFSKDRNHIAIETGGYQGKNAICLQMAAQACKVDLKTLIPEYMIEPEFDLNVASFGLEKHIVRGQTEALETRADLLFVDGPPSYYHIHRSFSHHEPRLGSAGFVLFTNYTKEQPDTQTFVNELISSGRYKLKTTAGSFALLQHQGKETKPTIGRQKFGNRSQPVTCIMPTNDRPEFVKKSISLFLQQGYDQAELLVVDDGEQSVESLCDQSKNIRYLRLNEKKSLGEKRNLACAMSQSEIILHWDDDDWYHPDWIARLVAELTVSDADVSGLDNPYFYSPALRQAWQYRYPDSVLKPWVHGATLTYKKVLWEANPFPDISVGEDCEFLWCGVNKKVTSFDFADGYIGCIHSGNTSPKHTTDGRWRSIPCERLERLMQEPIASSGYAEQCIDDQRQNTG